MWLDGGLRDRRRTTMLGLARLLCPSTGRGRGALGDRNGHRKSSGKLRYPIEILASSAAPQTCPPPSARPQRSAAGHRGARLSPLDLALHLLPISFESVPIHLATFHSQAALISAQSRATGREASSSQPPFECAPHRQCKRNCRQTSTGSTPRRALASSSRPTAAGMFRAHRRRRARLNEGQKVSYDLVPNRRTGKSSAENLRAGRLVAPQPEPAVRAWRAGPQKTGRQTGRMADGVLVVV